jgi:hypothetical protein
VEWPEALVAELASRRCIVFLGSGASAQSLSRDGKRRPPTWKKLLETLSSRVPDEEAKKISQRMIRQRAFLDAAEVIVSQIPRGDLNKILRDEFKKPRFGPSPIHQAVLRIDPKVVITTNFDKVYEDYCSHGDAAEGYYVCRYDESHLVTDLRSPIRLIVKAHGCIGDASRIILTKSEYFGARQKHSDFYRVLDSLFLTHTLFFVGYSLKDPDIQLVLENANIAAPSHHPHYALVPQFPHPSIREACSKSYNIEFIEYTSKSHKLVDQALADLADQVTALRQENPST